jgi:phosphatidylinositol 4-kinase A
VVKYKFSVCLIIVMFSYSDPFYHAVEYSPSDREAAERTAKSARRLLLPHQLILQLLVSRLQAARYRKPGLMLLLQHLTLASARAHGQMRQGPFYPINEYSLNYCYSTHPLARDARFSLLLFGFEVLRSSHLDAYCEHQLRNCLYQAAFSWFSVRPQWVIPCSKPYN